MIANGRSDIRAYIEDTGEYLQYLLRMYPSLLDTWMCEKEKECRSIAKESSEGDTEVETSIFHSLFKGFNSFWKTEILFYDAVFIMVYSYYESVIMKLSQKYNCCNRPSVICEINHIQLSSEAQENTSFLCDKIWILRNQFCHNFLGTIGAKNKEDNQIVKELSQQYPDSIYLNDSSIHILRAAFVSEVLEKENFVINELINKLNI